MDAEWFTRKWSWYYTIDKVMTKGDRTKMEFYFKMNVYEFLNHLCYLQDKTDSKQ